MQNTGNKQRRLHLILTAGVANVIHLGRVQFATDWQLEDGFLAMGMHAA